MTDRKLDIAFWNYDRTQKLTDGSVRIGGVDAASGLIEAVTQLAPPR